MNDSPIGLNIIKIFDTIGFLGPFILLTIGIWQLWGNHGFWCAYLVVTIVNSFVNKIVKSIVKQPRPFDGESIMDEGYNGCEMYGMPSGHSQSVFSSLTFLYLKMENEKKSKKNSKVKKVCGFAAVIKEAKPIIGIHDGAALLLPNPTVCQEFAYEVIKFQALLGATANAPPEREPNRFLE